MIGCSPRECDIDSAPPSDLKLVDYGPGGSKDECAVVTLRLMKAAVESALKKAADLVKPKPTTGVNADPVQSL